MLVLECFGELFLYPLFTGGNKLPMQLLTLLFVPRLQKVHQILSMFSPLEDELLVGLDHFVCWCVSGLLEIRAKLSLEWASNMNILLLSSALTIVIPHSATVILLLPRFGP